MSASTTEPAAAAVFRIGAPLGSSLAVSMVLDAVFPDDKQRSLVEHLLAERGSALETETAETLLLALSELLPPHRAADPVAAAALEAAEWALVRGLVRCGKATEEAQEVAWELHEVPSGLGF